ncbi:MAG: BRCT domain-containing protein [Thiolinea sp.]
MHLTFATVQHAWEVKDPALVDYLVQLAQQGRPEPEQAIRDEALTFDRFLQHIFSTSFREQPAETQKAYRQQQIALLEADDAEVPLPESLKLYRLILQLWLDESYYARLTLIEAIRRVPIVYGPWKAIKHIYKAAEAQNDYELLGEIAARIDTAAQNHQISTPTLIYMKRRAWRYLRELGEAIPVCYPEAAIHYLAAYPDNTDWRNTWLANHIFYHDSKNYGRNTFYVARQGKGHWLKKRAFTETWKRSPEPLLRLMEIARSETMREYASDALKTDFAITLRTIETHSILSLMAINANSPTVDSFIVWTLKQASRFEQHQFRELGLHDGIIRLLESPAADARQYACDYVRAHARDLALDKLLLLADNPQQNVRKLAQQLIGERDPRKDIGLDAWGILLESEHANPFASQALLKHFGRKELNQAWFSARFLTASTNSVKFASGHLLELHPLKTLGADFFQAIMQQLDISRPAAWQSSEFALQQLEAIGLNQLSSEFVQTFLLHPLAGYTLRGWLLSDEIKLSLLPVDYCKAIACEADWHDYPLIQQLHQSEQSWAQQLRFDEDLAETMRELLSDVRRINPSELGFEWLMQLVNREEATYHNFATDRMIKAFLPADFAPQDTAGNNTQAATNDEPAPEAEINVDFDGQTFLFTGKLMTMTRKEAQGKVTAANGKNSSAVNGKLDYLVIGDEGSPMYGNGRKGSKQVKAEALIENGATMKIISETAFLQMLAGEQREFSEDSITAGCETLWHMLLDKPDTPIGKFARKYIRYHHPAICLQETDRPVDPGAEMPEEFLSFQRFESLFNHDDYRLRKFALEFAHWEFARWSPASAELIRLCESKHTEVREFTTNALLETADADNKHYCIDAGQLEASAVYSFCESKDPKTRQLGMQIIQQHQRFQLPAALFQLTESPDRELRAFVVRVLWAQYRRYSTSRNWQPRLPDMADIGKKKQEAKAEAERNLGTGLPGKPEQWPASKAELQQLLQRWLYELPPGRLSGERLKTTLKPLSASAAKKALIETLRDLALEDIAFAEMVLPLFSNFTRSRGAMEQAACLVAVTRIRHQHPTLSPATGEAA